MKRHKPTVSILNVLWRCKVCNFFADIETLEHLVKHFKDKHPKIYKKVKSVRKNVELVCKTCHKKV